MSVYQHWDPLKKVMLGAGYPPEFYSWIKNSKARSAMEKIAVETEEDFQGLTKLLENKFGVEVIRPSVSENYDDYYCSHMKKFARPPMTPRDHTGCFGNKFFVDTHFGDFKENYKNVKADNWPEMTEPSDIDLLEDWQILELKELHHIDPNHTSVEKLEVDPICECLLKNNVDIIENSGTVGTSTADVVRVGKDLIYPKYKTTGTDINQIKNVLGEDYRINFYNGDSHGDGCFCPVVPGLIVSLEGYVNYEKTFPGWEVIELPGQSWDKVQPFLDLKNKNKGKWWVPGEENNDSLTTCVEDWLDNWVGYVEETVFDVNMLVVDEKNVICNNYNKKVFDAFERYGVTPHIFNFRHRYFWDGGLHCISADIHREGTMKDYFPERNEY